MHRILQRNFQLLLPAAHPSAARFFRPSFKNFTPPPPRCVNWKRFAISGLFTIECINSVAIRLPVAAATIFPRKRVLCFILATWNHANKTEYTFFNSANAQSKIHDTFLSLSLLSSSLVFPVTLQRHHSTMLNKNYCRYILYIITVEKLDPK